MKTLNKVVAVIELAAVAFAGAILLTPSLFPSIVG
jgi:hypothetical protein